MFYGFNIEKILRIQNTIYTNIELRLPEILHDKWQS